MSADDILALTPSPADLRVAYGSDPNQFGDLRLPKCEGPFPVLMNIHGGYWRAKYDLEHAGHLCAALTTKGIATWNVEYRRVGNQGGGWPGTIEDIKHSYRFLPEIAQCYNLDLTRILVMGHSAGAHLALCLAAQEPSVKRVISLAGVVDLERAWQKHLSDDAVVELLGGKPNDVPERYKAANPAQLSIAKTTQWLIHGLKDDLVPPEFSHDYHDSKKKLGEDVHLLEIQQADHFDVINPSSAAWLMIEQTIMGLLCPQILK